MQFVFGQQYIQFLFEANGNHKTNCKKAG